MIGSLPRRRWPRFTVRALLIAVTICCLWLGWQVSVVRERRAVLRWLAGGAGWSITLSDYQQIPSGPPSDPDAVQLPPWRVWLGDEPIAQIGFDASVEQSERDRVKKLFPEAYVSDQ